jgi:hypothetical protein
MLSNFSHVNIRIHLGQDNAQSTMDLAYCPLIETLSFGSDINIRCNTTYFRFHQFSVSREDNEQC